MNEENSGILVGEIPDGVLIRVDGRGTHLNSHFLKRFMIRSLDDGKKSFHIDLSLCNYMDSTFLGTLAGIAGKVKALSLPPIRMFSATDRIRGMLESLGIHHLFEMTESVADQTDLQNLSGSDLSKDEKSRHMLDAHEKLVEANVANAIKFRDVILLLRDSTKGSTTP